MIKGNRSFDISEIMKLGEIFRRYPDIKEVYLFGSTASGYARPDSDLDLAVIPADTSAEEKKLDILAELANRGYCDVDPIFIDKDNPILAYEAIRQNKLIYATGNFDRRTGTWRDRDMQTYSVFHGFSQRVDI